MNCLLMKFDTAFIDLKNINIVTIQNDGALSLKIFPIIYNDNRNPRLPRKHSKQTNLQIDTNYIFRHAFNDININLDKTSRFRVNIIIHKCNDSLGSGDLDNYCKAILDAITSTKKIWYDDRQVDEIFIKRYYNTDNQNSYIDLTINKL